MDVLRQVGVERTAGLFVVEDLAAAAVRPRGNHVYTEPAALHLQRNRARVRPQILIRQIFEHPPKFASDLHFRRQVQAEDNVDARRQRYGGSLGIRPRKRDAQQVLPAPPLQEWDHGIGCAMRWRAHTGGDLIFLNYRRGVLIDRKHSGKGRLGCLSAV